MQHLIQNIEIWQLSANGNYSNYYTNLGTYKPNYLNKAFDIGK